MQEGLSVQICACPDLQMRSEVGGQNKELFEDGLRMVELFGAKVWWDILVVIRRPEGR